MLNVKLEELPMPTTDRSVDRLVGWFVESFCFVSRKGDATADYGAASPIHRMLRDYFFSAPNKSWDAQALSDELAMTPAALNHHLSRLSAEFPHLRQPPENECKPIIAFVLLPKESFVAAAQVVHRTEDQQCAGSEGGAKDGMDDIFLPVC